MSEDSVVCCAVVVGVWSERGVWEDGEFAGVDPGAPQGESVRVVV